MSGEDSLIRLALDSRYSSGVDILIIRLGSNVLAYKSLASNQMVKRIFS